MNLQAEIRNGYYISAQMKQVWSIQMKMLAKLLSVCEKYNLKVWASSGTLLGAVREKGFIPWDDDIDMEMMRDDYEKLVSVAEKEFESPFFFQCAYTEKAPYPIGHAQIRYDNTTAVIPGMEFWNTHLGIFIDIFILDNAPVGDTQIKAYSEKVIKAQKVLYAYVASFKSIINPIRYIGYLKSLFIRSRKPYIEAFKEYDDALKSVSESSMLIKSCLISSEWYLKNRQLKKEYYESTILLPFEDILIPVPSGYDGILSTLYGEYMKPAQVPTLHGGFLLLDPNADYKVKLKSLRKKSLKKAIYRKLGRLLK